jgi:hypothetical protein
MGQKERHPMPDVNTRHCVLIVDSIDCTDSVSRAEVTSAESDSDFVSFAQAAAGGARDYALALTMKQNTSSTTLWDLMWSQAGEEVPVVVWPNGKPVGDTPSPTQPKFTGTVTVKDPDGTVLGGEANASTTARQVSEVEWLFTEKPLRVTA